MFNKIPAFDASVFTAPALKIMDLNVSVISKALDDQQSAAKALLSLSQERAKAALEIKDYEGFVSFSKEQAEIAKNSALELAEKSQVAAKDAQAYFNELKTIAA